MKAKKCAKCGEIKELSCFSKSKTTKDGHQYKCKECVKKYNKEYQINKQEYFINKSKLFYENNKELVSLTKKEKYKLNSNGIKIKVKEYYKNNKDKVKQQKQLYRINNIKKLNEYNKDYVKKRRENIVYKLKCNIRNVISRTIKNKKSRTHKILGCSYDDFKNYIESLWESWMNWDNYGKYNGELNYGWDIDHRVPLSSAKTEDDVIALNHYTNLQPLCSYINRVIKINNI